ncbi:glycosyl hydrolase family 95 catalytic domain-containing protein [Flavivirga eckloniae]|nr:glycoside hydrolase N-terminal domain-containing protein [Flavivirga eckloniae]
MYRKIYFLLFTLFTGSIFYSFGQEVKKIETNSIVINNSTPTEDWEESLVSGNGAQGVMVYGHPLRESIVLNHEKLWIPGQSVYPDVPNIVPGLNKARELAKQSKWKEANRMLWRSFCKGNVDMFSTEDLSRPGPRLNYNSVHPGHKLNIRIDELGSIVNYNRSLELNSGEITTSWEDFRGKFEKSVFVSRPDNVIVTRVKCDGLSFGASINIKDIDGWKPEDIRKPLIEHGEQELYYKTSYVRLHGLPEPDGYHSLSRVITKGGNIQVKSDRLIVSDVNEIIVITRLDYLPVASKPERQALSISLSDLPASYEALYNRHTVIQAEMMNRCSLNLGGNNGAGKTTDEILFDAKSNGPSPEFLELLFAVGRYAFIASSGDLPPALMGIWGNTWTPNWWGHYTNDSNLNLAVASGSVTNLPEMMESYFSWIESLYPDWKRNAAQLYGADGYMAAIAHGWRHGIALGGWNEWIGGAGWLGSYFYEHYQFTDDKEFLKKRVIPLFENIVSFYEGAMKDMEMPDGKFLVWPGCSVENAPADIRRYGEQGAPNATHELAVMKYSFNVLIDGYRTLGINEERIPELEAFISKIPEYMINDVGALAEWSHPDMNEQYNNNHNSHLWPLYPGTEITPWKSSPKLIKACKIAIRERNRVIVDTNRCGHGIMHLGYMGARLNDPKMAWRTLDVIARNDLIYNSFVSSHNSLHHTFNLDASLSLPGLMAEMCVTSAPGRLALLSGLPLEKLPHGEIKGILARKGIKINKMVWDRKTGTINMNLTSVNNQEVIICSRLELTDLKANTKARKENDEWLVRLPKNKNVRLTIKFKE